MKEINIDEKLAGQKMMRCLERYLSNAPKSFLYKMLRKKNITLNNSKATGDEKLKCGDIIKIFFSDETFEKFSADNNRTVNDDYYNRIYRPMLYSLISLLACFHRRQSLKMCHLLNI